MKSISAFPFKKFFASLKRISRPISILTRKRAALIPLMIILIAAAAYAGLTLYHQEGQAALKKPSTITPTGREREMSPDLFLNPRPSAELVTGAGEQPVTSSVNQPADVAPFNGLEAQLSPQGEKNQADETQDPGQKKMTLPVNGVIGTTFGQEYSKTFEDFRFHPGIDLLTAEGSPVVAAMDGTVKSITDSLESGTTITIDHGSEWMTVYAGCDKVQVKVGEQVAEGQQIARVGSPGAVELADGPHLHFELRHQDTPEDPRKKLK